MNVCNASDTQLHWHSFKYRHTIYVYLWHLFTDDPQLFSVYMFFLILLFAIIQTNSAFCVCVRFLSHFFFCFYSSYGYANDLKRAIFRFSLILDKYLYFSFAKKYLFSFAEMLLTWISKLSIVLATRKKIVWFERQKEQKSLHKKGGCACVCVGVRVCKFFISFKLKTIR